jgi:hypothetical protein
MNSEAIDHQPVKGRLRRVDLAGSTVEVGDDDEFIESRLRGGTLLVQARKRWPAVTMSTFEDCEVRFPKRTSSGRVNLLAARFVRCSFHGFLNGIDFGSNSADGELDAFGRLEACDFSGARLNGCRFLNCDIASLRFPPPPHIVILSPSSRKADVERIAWPGQLGAYMRVCTDKPEYFSASVFHLPTICKLTKCSEAEAVEALKAFGGVDL